MRAAHQLVETTLTIGKIVIATARLIKRFSNPPTNELRAVM